MYQAEADAVRAEGIPFSLISFEALAAGSAAQAVRRVPTQATPIEAMYRGWMLKPAQYQPLYDALLERGVRLLNTPDMYRYCHYLPESYPIIAPHTPRSVWLRHDESFSMASVFSALETFGEGPVIVKDYVKSQKHYWHEACFIPNAADHEAVAQVVERFLELQGDDLNEGLVFREFIPFSPLAEHSRSGMPLTQEYRVFVLDGQPVFHTRYWSEGVYRAEPPEQGQFAEVMAQVNSRFFTMDIARREDGPWMIVELGDGQVAGLPDHVTATAFYRPILERWLR